MKFAVFALLSAAGAFDFGKMFDKIKDDFDHPDHFGDDVAKGLKHVKHNILDKHHHGVVGKEFDKLRDGVKDILKKDEKHDDKKEEHDGPFGPPPPRHPHCAINAEFDHPCDELWQAMHTEISGMHPGGDHPDPAGGKYVIVKNVTDKAIWAYRTEEFGKKTY